MTWWRQNRWQAIICDGAVRSGKTFCMGLSFFLWAQSCFHGRQLALCGKTAGALRRNLLTELVGGQLKLMLDNLNQQETAMTEMFSGKIKKEPKTFTIRLTPKEMKDEVAFRFSRKLGVVANNDLAGEPYYISVTDLKSPDVSATEEGKKKVDGVAYNLPGKAQVTLMYNNKKLFDDQLPITQFGTVEYLAPVLFNKNSTIKVLFDTATGGLIKVDRE